MSIRCRLVVGTALTTPASALSGNSVSNQLQLTITGDTQEPVKPLGRMKDSWHFNNKKLPDYSHFVLMKSYFQVVKYPVSHQEIRQPYLLP